MNELAVYRTISLSFWTDNKITDDFTPEDRYFYLYLLTNSHTNLSGCYEISFKQMARETGYNEETINRLVERMEKYHKVIKYDNCTKELLIWNWYKYNWNKSDKLIQGVRKSCDKIKSTELKKVVLNIVDCVENGNTFDRGLIGYVYPMHTSVTVSDINNNININNHIIKDIIDYLNIKLNTKYTYKGSKTVACINARLKEGFTLDDFKKVIDKKYKSWGNNPEMSKYLRPETLFGTKFESYLNELDKGDNKSTSSSYEVKTPEAENPFTQMQRIIAEGKIRNV